MFVYLHFIIPLYQTKCFSCGNVRDEKTIELIWNAYAFHSAKKTTGKVSLHKSNTLKLLFKTLDSYHSWKRNGLVFHDNTKVINRVFISCITEDQLCQTNLTKQFVKGKDFSNLVPDSWLCSSRLEYRIRFYSVWRQMNWFELNELPNGNSNCNVFKCRVLLPMFACSLVRLTVAKFYHRLLKKPLAFTNWKAKAKTKVIIAFQ